MGILLRYACLLGLGLASIFTFVSATAVTGQRLAASGGYVVQDSGDTIYIVLAVICVLGLFSVVRSVFRGPLYLEDWMERRRYARRRMRIGPLLLACAIGFVFLVT